MKWRHEDGSVSMLRHIIESKGIRLPDHGLTEDIDLVFIEEMIAGTLEKDRKGRPNDKFYLYGNVHLSTPK